MDDETDLPFLWITVYGLWMIDLPGHTQCYVLGGDTGEMESVQCHLSGRFTYEKRVLHGYSTDQLKLSYPWI